MGSPTGNPHMEGADIVGAEESENQQLQRSRQHGATIAVLQRQQERLTTSLGRLKCSRSENAHEGMERVQGIGIMTHQLHNIDHAIQIATGLMGGPFPWETTDYARKQNDELEGCYAKWSKSKHGLGRDIADERQHPVPLAPSGAAAHQRRAECHKPSASVQGWKAHYLLMEAPTTNRANGDARITSEEVATKVASCDKVVADAAKLRTAYKEQKTRLAKKDEWAVEARAEARKLKSELDFWREEHSEQIQQAKDSNSAGWFSGLDLMTWGSSETCSTDTGQASEANRESRERDELLREVRCWKAMYAKEARLHETAAANVARLGAELAHWRRHEDRSTKSDRTAHEKSTRSDAAHEKSTRSDRAFNDRSTESDPSIRHRPPLPPHFPAPPSQSSSPSDVSPLSSLPHLARGARWYAGVQRG
ncbi:unnamed protein product [Prorocentrum cordatum]|uniref:Uncharacterized protein n=1 Tax=Prorocentrum cordatum TaxID=2364126 RepID=A0ABN9SFY1_9DINO|nr:unnamed protein product [Polarella glacialis]